MTRLALILATSIALTAPVAADSLSILLPSPSFPSDTVTTSTKGCAAVVQGEDCQPAE